MNCALLMHIFLIKHYFKFYDLQLSWLLRVYLKNLYERRCKYVITKQITGPHPLKASAERSKHF